MEFKINASVRMKGHKIFLNNRCVISGERILTSSEFLKKAYTDLEIFYPKFHKMDVLSKMGIITTELLFRGKIIPENTALVFSNSSSSIGADEMHQKAMDQSVSPSVFVYTLPNIVMGEICLKNKIYGENSFFITEKFNPVLVWEYSQSLLDGLAAPAIVCGWIEWKNDEYDVFLCLVTRDGDQTFSAENLEALYYFENE